MKAHYLYQQCFYFLLFTFFCIPYSSFANSVTDSCPKQVFSPFSTIQNDQLYFLPQYGCIANLQLAGRLPVNSKKCINNLCDDQQGNLFYWFVANKTNQQTTPIILWLNGGPGASSFYGFFSENGPYTIDVTGTLHDRAHAWNDIAHFLMIDNPKGVGLSYAAKNNPIKNEKQATIELFNALNAFYQRYPELRNNPLYLSGESYAGKYIAELAEQIVKHNDQSKTQFNLQGIIIGDGWVNPLIQQSSVADYAYYHGLIDKNTHKQVKKIYKSCADAINKHSEQANTVCMKVNDTVAQASGVDRHDIRTLSEMDYTPIIKYLNKPEVMKALHADPRIKQFKLFSNEVSQNLEQEIQKSAAPIYEFLLNKKIPILIYNGLEDGTDSNFAGTDLWLEQLNWHGQKDFKKARTCKWYNNKNLAGYVRQNKELTQIKIRGAGHMAPMDQPENILEMVNVFIQRQNWCQLKLK